MPVSGSSIIQISRTLRPIMAIASDGFVFVPRCVDNTTLQALRAEADSLFRLKRSKDALSEDEYFDKVQVDSLAPDEHT